MFKELFNHIDLGHVGETGLLLFFIVFVVVSIRAITHRRSEVDYWASLPLQGGDESQDQSQERNA